MQVYQRGMLFLLACSIFLLGMVLTSCEELTGGSDPGEDDYEPNNSRSEAYSLTIGGWINGGLSETDADWFSFSPVHSSYEVYLIEAENQSDELELNLTLYDEDGNELGSQGGGNGANVSINFSCVAGTYYLKITSRYGTNTGDYRLRISPTNTNDAYEPNETADAAYDLGQTPVSGIAAALASPYEKDFYSFTMTHESYDRLDVTLVNGGEELELEVTLYDTQGNQLESKSSQSGADLSFSYSCLAGTYIIEVASLYESAKGSYTLSLENASANDEYEPNESSDDSYQISSLPATAFEGVIVDGSEYDWYQFSTSNTTIMDYVDIAITNGDSEFEPEITLYDDQMDRLHNTHASTPGSNISLSMLTRGGTYYLKLGSLYESSTGSYTMSITERGANDNNEPDDTFEDALLVNTFPSENLTGTIVGDASGDSGDFEFFKVFLKGDKKVTFSLSPEADNTELHFKLYDADQTYLTIRDGSEGETLDFYVNNSGSTDTYFYLKVGGFTGDNGHYTISFVENDANTPSKAGGIIL